MSETWMFYSGTSLIMDINDQRGRRKCPFSEVSSFQRSKCMQEWYLGWENVSCLERCPQFRGVLIESFHCIHMSTYIPIAVRHTYV